MRARSPSFVRKSLSRTCKHLTAQDLRPLVDQGKSFVTQIMSVEKTIECNNILQDIQFCTNGFQSKQRQSQWHLPIGDSEDTVNRNESLGITKKLSRDMSAHLGSMDRNINAKDILLDLTQRYNNYCPMNNNSFDRLKNQYIQLIQFITIFSTELLARFCIFGAEINCTGVAINCLYFTHRYS